MKLARKSVDVFGSSVIEEGKNKHQVDFGCDDDTLSLQAGKEFALMLTSQGRVHYTGRVESEITLKLGCNYIFFLFYSLYFSKGHVF